jgi:hypothetical protein
MSLERIIRPFATREVTPPRVAIAGNSVSTANASTAADTVTITIGKSFKVKTVNGSETIDVTYYLKKWMKEKKEPSV